MSHSSGIQQIFFDAIDRLTETECEIWTLDALSKFESCRLLELTKILKQDHDYSYSSVQKALASLIRKDLAQRISHGIYKANYFRILWEAMKMLGQLEERSAEFQ